MFLVIDLALDLAPRLVLLLLLFLVIALARVHGFALDLAFVSVLARLGVPSAH